MCSCQPTVQQAISAKKNIFITSKKPSPQLVDNCTYSTMAFPLFKDFPGLDMQYAHIPTITTSLLKRNKANTVSKFQSYLFSSKSIKYNPTKQKIISLIWLVWIYIFDENIG